MLSITILGTMKSEVATCNLSAIIYRCVDSKLDNNPPRPSWKHFRLACSYL